MRTTEFFCFALCGALFFATGCQKKKAPVDTGGFKTALDTYYQSHPACTWTTPMQIPVLMSAEKPDAAKEQQLDALVSAGLLSKKETHKEVEDAHHRRHRERMLEYDLTDQGKSAWTASQSLQGAGNFCIGSPTVDSIDQYTPAPNTSRYSVSYHFSVGQPPSWANSDQIRAAFPNLTAELSHKKLAALAILTKTSNGWTASAVQPIL